MRASVWAAATALLALAAARRADQDFEFDDDDADAGVRRRYTYDPHSPLCRELVCKKREVCVLRDAFTALCAAKKDVLRKGGAEPAEEDVFYERPSRCVGCGGGARAQFLCGSDNRTYSSPCRLDLHNCVRRPAAPVTPACRGFCPCRAPPCALDRMADRLLDWFAVLMDEARASPPPPAGFPSGCKAEVRWMFRHLDADGSGALSSGELYALRHDARERCLRPFLGTCARGAAGVTRAAWCACLRRAARPCAALARAAHARGGWAPACDARGFYRPRQCHAALAACWCVDAHGAELPGTRTKGEPPCPAPPAPPADDEDAPGSGDGDRLY